MTAFRVILDVLAAVGALWLVFRGAAALDRYEERLNARPPRRDDEWPWW